MLHRSIQTLKEMLPHIPSLQKSIDTLTEISESNSIESAESKEELMLQPNPPANPSKPTTIKKKSLPKAPVKAQMNDEECVKRLKEYLDLSSVDHDEEVMTSPSFKEAHVYCINNRLSAQQYGPLLEKYIRTKFNYTKNNAKDCIGDGYKDGKNSEVKVSLGGKHNNKFNFVQIRPSHECDVYILTAYHLSYENYEKKGELYIFKIPKEDIKQIIVAYGGYAHGTTKEHGSITIDSVNDKSTKEYALRPTVNDNCWKALLPYRVDESAL